IITQNSTNGNARLRDAAIAYHRRGLCVLPIAANTKKPAVGWKKYQETRPSESDVFGWFCEKRFTGVGVLLGPVSGLWCRDFDVADAYHLWANCHPDLASILPTVKTNRGYHVYAGGTLDKTTKLPDGELRGHKGFNVLPPSPHPSGSVYS